MSIHPEAETGSDSEQERIIAADSQSSPEDTTEYEHIDTKSNTEDTTTETVGASEYARVGADANRRIVGEGENSRSDTSRCTSVIGIRSRAYLFASAHTTCISVARPHGML